MENNTRTEKQLRPRPTQEQIDAIGVLALNGWPVSKIRNILPFSKATILKYAKKAIADKVLIERNKQLGEKPYNIRFKF